MKKIAFTEDFFTQDSKAASFINDWYDLGLHLGVQTYYLSYAKRNRSKMQKCIQLTQGKETRIVYNSSGCLKMIQNRLIPMMTNLIEEVPNDQMIAYRKGINPMKAVQELENQKYLIKFDIKKYYDHVTSRKIRDTLMTHGLTRLGAQLIAHYCVVQRKLPNGKILQTLQQGSSVSPVISNLVGYEYIDKYVINWLENYKLLHPEVSYKFFRYSDNIAIGLDSTRENSIGIEALRDFKAYIKAALGAHSFRTHKWSIIPNTHPKRNQKFLGVVLNKIARIEKAKYEAWRATLFNACRNGLGNVSHAYWEDRGRFWDTDVTRTSYYHTSAQLKQEVDTKKFLMVVQGRNSYLNSINEWQKLELDKLLKAAKYLHEVSRSVYTPVEITLNDGESDKVWGGRVLEFTSHKVKHTKVLHTAKMEAVKRYKNKNESLDEYLDNLKEA